MEIQVLRGFGPAAMMLMADFFNLRPCRILGKYQEEVRRRG
jgi:hypothetical protein